jgi:hypothetical protein
MDRRTQILNAKRVNRRRESAATEWQAGNNGKFVACFGTFVTHAKSLAAIGLPGGSSDSVQMRRGPWAKRLHNL